MDLVEHDFFTNMKAVAGAFNTTAMLITLAKKSDRCSSSFVFDRQNKNKCGAVLPSAVLCVSTQSLYAPCLFYIFT